MKDRKDIKSGPPYHQTDHRLRAAAIAFTVFSALAGTGWLNRLDLSLVKLAQTYPTDALDSVGKLFSWFGDLEVTGAALILLCAGLLLAGWRALAWRLAAAFIATGLLELALKFLLPVPPIPSALGRTTDPSPIVALDYPYPYPSGHMLRTIILTGAIFALWRNRLARAAIVIFLAGEAATRVYLGVHWPSDLIGGALLGLAGLAWAFRGRSGSAAQRPRKR